MGVIDRFKALLFGVAQKSHYDTPISLRGVEVGANGLPSWWPLNFGEYSYGEQNFANFVNQGYGRNPYVFMVVDKVASLVSILPIFLQDKDGNPKEDKAIQALIDVPNSQESWEELIYRIVSSYMVTGNAIVYETSAIGFNRPSEIHCALTQDVTIFTDTGTEQGNPIRYSILNVGNIDASRVLHIKRPNIINNSVWGVSALHAGQTVYEGSNNTLKAAASIHKNRGASGIISSDSSDMPMQPKERDKVQRDFNADTAGAHNMGLNYVSAIPLRYIQIGMSATDLRLIEFDVKYLRAICGLFSVPSVLFGDTERSTYNNVKEAKTALYTDAVLPMAVTVYGQLSKWLVQNKFRTQLSIEVDKSDIQALNEDKNELHKRVLADVGAGVITPQEGREILYPNLKNALIPTV